MTLFVDVSINGALCCSRCSGRDYWRHSFGFDCFDNCIGVVALVTDEVFALRFFDEDGSFGDVVNVSGGEVDVERITETVNESVDFGGKASARASNTLNLGPPFPPAASWCARM